MIEFCKTHINIIKFIKKCKEEKSRNKKKKFKYFFIFI